MLSHYEATADLVLEEQGTSVEKVKAEAAKSDKIMLELMAQIDTKMAKAALAAHVMTEKAQAPTLPPRIPS